MYLDLPFRDGGLEVNVALNQIFEVVVDEFKNHVLNELALVVFGEEEVLSLKSGYFQLHNILALLDHVQDLVLAAQLLPHLLHSLDC